MLDFVFCCALFTMGIIAACVDWNHLSRRFLHFDDYVKIIEYEKNSEGVYTGHFENVLVQNTFNPKIIIAIILILCILFFFIIYIPAKMLFEHLESKYLKLFSYNNMLYRQILTYNCEIWTETYHIQERNEKAWVMASCIF